MFSVSHRSDLGAVRAIGLAVVPDGSDHVQGAQVVLIEPWRAEVRPGRSSGRASDEDLQRGLGHEGLDCTPYLPRYCAATVRFAVVVPVPIAVPVAVPRRHLISTLAVPSTPYVSVPELTSF